MSWNDLIYGIGDFVEWTFQFLEMGGDAVNWFFIVLTFVILCGWVSMQIKYIKEDKRNGNLL